MKMSKSFAIGLLTTAGSLISLSSQAQRLNPWPNKEQDILKVESDEGKLMALKYRFNARPRNNSDTTVVFDQIQYSEDNKHLMIVQGVGPKDNPVKVREINITLANDAINSEINYFIEEAKFLAKTVKPSDPGADNSVGWIEYWKKLSAKGNLDQHAQNLAKIMFTAD